MNLKKQQSLYNQYQPKITPLTVGEYTYNAETKLPSSTESGSAQYQPAKLKEDLEYLNKKMELVRKSITAWDLLKINYIADTEQDALMYLSILQPNESLIFNLNDTARVEISRRIFKKGDVCIKDNAGTLHVISLATSGYYYPSKYDDENSVITYSFTTDTPSDGAADLSTSSITPFENINFTPKINSEPGYYDYRGTLNGEASVDINDIQNSRPVINFYISGTGERIHFSGPLYTLNDEGIIISNPCKFAIEYEVR